VKLMVLACTASLKVAVAVDEMATFEAPDAGVSLVTVGLIEEAAVVNDHSKGDVMPTPEMLSALLTAAV
jgi:hypothetical protein